MDFRRWLNGLAILLLLTFLPILPGMLMSVVSFGHYDFNHSCLAVLPWLMTLTIPIGAVAIFLWIVLGLVAVVVAAFRRRKQGQTGNDEPPPQPPQSY